MFSVYFIWVVSSKHNGAEMELKSDEARLHYLSTPYPPSNPNGGCSPRHHDVFLFGWWWAADLLIIAETCLINGHVGGSPLHHTHEYSCISLCVVVAALDLCLFDRLIQSRTETSFSHLRRLPSHLRVTDCWIDVLLSQPLGLPRHSRNDAATQTEHLHEILHRPIETGD
jgi:hypothetical protein